jgi:hypothetical protein
MPRIAATLIALVCWAGLCVQFAATYGRTGDIGLALWIIFRFFTIITNLFVAIAMTRLALGWRVSPFVLGGLTLAILLVGVVYMTLLRGLVHLSGGALLADTLLHKVSPVATALYWLLFAPAGRLRWSAPFWWSLYPLAYFAYALVRGSLEGHYAYPFMDVGKIGALQTGLNAVLMAAAFLVVGTGLVWLDRRRRIGSDSTNV